VIGDDPIEVNPAFPRKRLDPIVVLLVVDGRQHWDRLTVGPERPARLDVARLDGINARPALAGYAAPLLAQPCKVRLVDLSGAVRLRQNIVQVLSLAAVAGLPQSRLLGPIRLHPRPFRPRALLQRRLSPQQRPFHGFTSARMSSAANASPVTNPRSKSQYGSFLLSARMLHIFAASSTARL